LWANHGFEINAEVLHRSGYSAPANVWLVLNRQGITVARCTLERLMRKLGRRGVMRGKRAAPRSPDEYAVRLPTDQATQRRPDAVSPSLLSQASTEQFGCSMAVRGVSMSAWWGGWV
jgi:transposase InsO family protein